MRLRTGTEVALLPVMLAAILVARFARRAQTHRTALGTPAARTVRPVSQPATESELVAAAWNVGAGSSLSGLALIAELEGLDAAIATRYPHLRGRHDRIVARGDASAADVTRVERPTR